MRNTDTHKITFWCRWCNKCWVEEMEHPALLYPPDYGASLCDGCGAKKKKFEAWKDGLR